MSDTFVMDVTRIRDEARQHLKQGPVTPSNTTDIDQVITVLNQVVATEMVCYLRYSQNAIAAQGIDREQVASMFIDWLGAADPTSRRLIEEILKEEEDHADELNDLFTG